MCTHVRRGNFKKACELYDEELHSSNPRGWVKQFAARKLVCYVDENIFFDQIDAVYKAWNRRKLPVVLVTNDNEFADRVSQLKSEEHQIYTLNQLFHMDQVPSAALPVIEMTLCSRAKLIIANQYSTFSRGIFKKALWKRKHMLNYSFAWSKDFTLNYFEKDWLERQLDQEIAKRQKSVLE